MANGSLNISGGASKLGVSGKKVESDLCFTGNSPSIGISGKEADALGLTSASSGLGITGQRVLEGGAVVETFLILIKGSADHIQVKGSIDRLQYKT